MRERREQQSELEPELQPELQAEHLSQLHEQQRAFISQVLGDENFFPQAQALSLSLKDEEQSSFSNAQRFQLYHNNIAISFRGALAGVYPVVNKLVGDEFFHHLACEYSYRHPSRGGNLHGFGELLPTFLIDFPGVENLFYLPDVARLEWAYHRVFHAQEDAVLNIQKLTSLDEEASSRLRFKISSSCRVLSSAYPTLKIWQMNQHGSMTEEVDLDEGGVQLVVRRLGADVVFEPLNKATFTLLQSLSEGRLFVEACEEAVAADPDCDVGAMLKELIERRLLTEFSCS